MTSRGEVKCRGLHHLAGALGRPRRPIPRPVPAARPSALATAASMSKESGLKNESKQRKPGREGGPSRGTRRPRASKRSCCVFYEESRSIRCRASWASRRPARTVARASAQRHVRELVRSPVAAGELAPRSVRNVYGTLHTMFATPVSRSSSTRTRACSSVAICRRRSTRIRPGVRPPSLFERRSRSSSPMDALLKTAASSTQSCTRGPALWRGNCAQVVIVRRRAGATGQALFRAPSRPWPLRCRNPSVGGSRFTLPSPRFSPSGNSAAGGRSWADRRLPTISRSRRARAGTEASTTRSSDSTKTAIDLVCAGGVFGERSSRWRGPTALARTCLKWSARRAGRHRTSLLIAALESQQARARRSRATSSPPRSRTHRKAIVRASPSNGGQSRAVPT